MSADAKDEAKVSIQKHCAQTEGYTASDFGASAAIN